MSALLGQGVLAIWNGIAPGQDAEFLHWHVSEHIPERLSVPGFLRARRYVALQGSPAYFNFYEVTECGVLSSPDYLTRLNDPSDWTRAVVPHFTDTSRTLCRVLESRGHGVAGSILALRLGGAAGGLRGLPDALMQNPDICAAHLLEQDRAPAGDTAESAMRATPDASADSILLVESASAKALVAASTGLTDDALRERGAAPVARGLYQLDFLMDRAAS